MSGKFPTLRKVFEFPECSHGLMNPIIPLGTFEQERDLADGRTLHFPIVEDLFVDLAYEEQRRILPWEGSHRVTYAARPYIHEDEGECLEIALNWNYMDDSAAGATHMTPTSADTPPTRQELLREFLSGNIRFCIKANSPELTFVGDDPVGGHPYFRRLATDVNPLAAVQEAFNHVAMLHTAALCPANKMAWGKIWLTHYLRVLAHRHHSIVVENVTYQLPLALLALKIWWADQSSRSRADFIESNQWQIFKRVMNLGPNHDAISWDPVGGLLLHVDGLRANDADFIWAQDRIVEHRTVTGPEEHYGMRWYMYSTHTIHSGYFVQNVRRPERLPRDRPQDGFCTRGWEWVGMPRDHIYCGSLNLFVPTARVLFRNRYPVGQQWLPDWVATQLQEIASADVDAEEDECAACGESAPLISLYEESELVCLNCAGLTISGENPASLLNYSTDVHEVLTMVTPKDLKFVHVGFKNAAPLLMGVELEYNGADSNATAARRFMARKLEGHVIFKRDGSLNETGFEIVSVAAPKQIHVAKFAPIFEAFPSGLATNDANAGMHVHVSKAAMTPLTLARVGDFMHNTENTQFIELVAERSLSHWCRQDDKRNFGWYLSSIVGGNDMYAERHVALNTNKRHTAEFRVFVTPWTMLQFCKNLEFIDRLIYMMQAGWSAFTPKQSRHYGSFLTMVKSENRSKREDRSPSLHLYNFLVDKGAYS